MSGIRSLREGVTIGPYRLLAPLGEGGMGEVWTAQDTRLDRTVAIKFSKQEFNERFEREARAIAALNHPNICTLYDVGPDYLVMEYVEGTALAGPLPLDKVLLYARQICDALEAAHRKGITHRDLKPGNILVAKGGVKLLDFGLAKSAASLPGEEALAQAATVPAALTGRGVVLGTPQYMAPEQIEGKPADARSDMFALGCVLYEMVTGKKAFDGKTVSSVAGAILAKEPEGLRIVQPLAPVSLERVVLTCLKKDPDERFQNARDVRLALEWVGEAESAARAVRRPWLWPAVAGMAGLAAIVLAAVLWRRPVERPRPVHFRLDDANFARMSLPSPDGRYLLRRETDAKGRLALRSFETGVTRPLPGTEGAISPFWSEDGKQIAFVVAEPGLKLKILDTGTSVIGSAGASIGRGRGAWNEKGQMVFPNDDGLFLVTSPGADPRRLTTVDKRKHIAHTYPQALPGGTWGYVAFAINRWEWVGLDSEGRELGRVPIDGMPVFYDGSGLVIYPSGSLLRARRFDVRRWRYEGDPRVIAGPVNSDQRVGTRFWAGGGVLSWVEADITENELVWFDRQGNRQATLGELGDYSGPALSPDGQKLAVALRDPETGTRDLWSFDVATGQRTQLTNHAKDDFNPVWSPDGNRLAFTSDRTGIRSLWIREAERGGAEELVFSNGQALSAESFTSGGGTLLFTAPSKGWRIGQVALKDKGEQQLLDSAREGHISPDGKWLAYCAYQSRDNRRTVMLERYPPQGKPRVISEPGDPDPQWASKTGELFYTSLKRNRLMVVRFVNGEPVKPEPLFDLPPTETLLRNNFTVSPDGQRFLFVVKRPRSGQQPTHVLLNWPSTVEGK